MLAVKGIYQRGQLILNEQVPFTEPIIVIVTFLEEPKKLIPKKYELAVLGYRAANDTEFEKAAVWPDAKTMCGHYDKLGLIQKITKNPPAGAAICYHPGDSNWNYGHVAIAIGDGTEVGATSLTQGITQRDIYLGTGYQGWISAEYFDNNYP